MMFDRRLSQLVIGRSSLAVYGIVVPIQKEAVPMEAITIGTINRGLPKKL
jgi:hypothetical protein